MISRWVILSFFIEVGDFVFWVILSLGDFATLPPPIRLQPHVNFIFIFPFYTCSAFLLTDGERGGPLGTLQNIIHLFPFPAKKPALSQGLFDHCCCCCLQLLLRSHSRNMEKASSQDCCCSSPMQVFPGIPPLLLF